MRELHPGFVFALYIAKIKLQLCDNVVIGNSHVCTYIESVKLNTGIW